ncbi:hypothetical protein TIFTF001_009380 [Ficus carica]|uniref:Uncharacterized protein n=1 Tax=Ficus carica TaxID=3494 RepID=A0AA88D2I9_FICCA|nr:hypothetical protein TIFTF001_009380 [Ficus carica]
MSTKKELAYVEAKGPEERIFGEHGGCFGEAEVGLAWGLVWVGWLEHNGKPLVGACDHDYGLDGYIRRCSCRRGGVEELLFFLSLFFVLSLL